MQVPISWNDGAPILRQYKAYSIDKESYRVTIGMMLAVILANPFASFLYFFLKSDEFLWAWEIPII